MAIGILFRKLSIRFHIAIQAGITVNVVGIRIISGETGNKCSGGEVPGGSGGFLAIRAIRWSRIAILYHLQNGQLAVQGCMMRRGKVLSLNNVARYFPIQRMCSLWVDCAEYEGQGGFCQVQVEAKDRLRKLCKAMEGNIVLVVAKESMTVKLPFAGISVVLCGILHLLAATPLDLLLVKKYVMSDADRCIEM